MNMNPVTSNRVQIALDAVQIAAADAKAAPDLTAAKAALNAVWFAVHRAQETINQAEAETRKAALDKLTLARTFA